MRRHRWCEQKEDPPATRRWECVWCLSKRSKTTGYAGFRYCVRLPAAPWWGFWTKLRPECRA